jgi:zinc transport system substrate-binding protein
LDDWATKLVEAVGVKSVVTTDKQIEVLKNDVTDDPFYWLSVPNAMLISKSVEDELSKIAPSKAKIIKQNQNEYAKKLAKLDFELRKQLAGAKSLDLAVFHGGWNYFARDYGLNIVASLEPVAGKLPSEEQITDFQTKVKVSKLKNVFAEPQFADASFLSLVSKMGIKVTNLDSLGTSSQDTYESLIRANVQRIVDESQ